ncbi:MAG: tagaturonate epimerase family protein [Oscillospiraceae bacterium]|nr:tagaturonate epimerase family protein [Oscillospiraceae bacterium]
MMDGVTIYQNSKTEYDGYTLYIAKDNREKFLVVRGNGKAFRAFEGYVTEDGSAKRCPLSNANAKTLRELFPFTAPSRHRGKAFTIGLGDRLGLASAGHIRLLQGTDVFPVLAQQSMRELNLTGRTYEDVLSAAAWAVFQEGWRGGYGADGDHLKTPDEIKYALDCGFTMITLDCSEHIRHIEGGTPEEIYGGAIKYTIDIYNLLLRGREIDFELSIDETTFATTPEAHIYVARELEKAGVELTSLAPRFCGEFQKGIDYRGDLNGFEKDFAAHAQIARDMGYKLSIHSGSDKFSVFPVIFRETKGNVHLKTAGTNWLEALRVVSQTNPRLFREITRFALENLIEAKKYYHITENTANIPDVETIGNEDLPLLLDSDDARQVLHITYGLILSAKDANGKTVFKDSIYSVLFQHEDDYHAALEKRIRRHLP